MGLMVHPGMNNSSDTSRLLIMGNETVNNAAISPPGGFGNTSSAPKNGNNPNDIDGGISSEGTLIFSLNDVKIYKIS